MKSAVKFACLAVMFLAGGRAVEAGVKVPLDKVPDAAVKAIKAKFPKATISSVDKENATEYEFIMKEGDRSFDVGVNADGKILGVKEEVVPDKLPDAIKKAVEKNYKGAKIEEAEKITKGEGKNAKVTYAVIIKTGTTSKEIELDETGKPVK